MNDSKVTALSKCLPEQYDKSRKLQPDSFLPNLEAVSLERVWWFELEWSQWAHIFKYLVPILYTDEEATIKVLLLYALIMVCCHSNSNSK